MDASARTKYRNDKSLYVFNNGIQSTFSDNSHSVKREQPFIAPQRSAISMDRKNGIQLVYKSKIVDTATAPMSPCIFSLDEAVNMVLLDQLSYTAANNLGPTKSSRLNYIFMATVAQAYNWTTPILAGTHDNWNWSTHYRANAMDTYVFVINALVAVLPTLIPGYDVRKLIALEQASMGWTPDQQTAYVYNVQTTAHYQDWLTAWNTWYTTRNNDNNVAAAIPPTAAQLPNGSTALNPATTQNITAYPNPAKWTPLIVSGKTQKYLTYNWNDVISSCLTAQNETDIKAAAAPYFQVNRVADINSLVSTVTQLQDIHKVQAEFWAGGPYTASPPGIYMYIWMNYAVSTKFSETLGMNAYILSGLELATNLFEVGRVVWGLKKQYMEARPIQEIRNMYANSTIASYTGAPISGALWMPFQTANFVTPPFADFPSGHSAYGRAFANVMTGWFGPTIQPGTPTTAYRMGNILSPVFRTNQTNPSCTYIFPAGGSETQSGVPIAPITLSFATWDDMTMSSGLSRQYGGIHAMSAHDGSLAAADVLTPIVNTSWGFRA